MSAKRKKYTKEFKTETVEYLLKSGKKLTEVSKSLKQALEDAEMEKAILKKAMAICSRKE